MDTIDAETIQKQIEMWEAATKTQRRYVEAQGKLQRRVWRNCVRKLSSRHQMQARITWIACREPSSLETELSLAEG